MKCSETEHCALNLGTIRRFRRFLHSLTQSLLHLDLCQVTRLAFFSSELAFLVTFLSVLLQSCDFVVAIVAASVRSLLVLLGNSKLCCLKMREHVFFFDFFDLFVLFLVFQVLGNYLDF